MNEIANWLKSLKADGIDIFLADGQVRCRAPKDKIIPEVYELLKSKKEQIEIYLFSQENSKFPLSYNQTALWTLYSIDKENPVYNVQCTLLLKPDTNLEILQESINRLIKRHKTLRTQFIYEGGKPLQQIISNKNYPLTVNKVSNWQRLDIDQWLQKEACKPFCLENGDVFRINLLTNDINGVITQTLLIVMPHICTDMFSINIFVDELSRTYSAVEDNKIPLLTPLINYNDYISWQYDLIKEHGEQLYNYWREQLSDKKEPLILPSTHSRPAVQTYNASFYGTTLDFSLATEIKNAAKKYGITPFVLMFSAYSLLLSRYSGQSKFVIGVPIAGRNFPHSENLLGYFVNPVPLGIDISYEDSLNNFLVNMRSLVLKAFEHQELPFSLLVEKLNPNRDPSYAPIFNVMYNWVQLKATAHEENHKNPLVLQFNNPTLCGASHDITLNIIEQDGKYTLGWSYNSDIFSEDDIRRLSSHFTQVVLEFTQKDPTKALTEIKLLSEEEWHQQMYEWNNTAKTYDLTKCLHHLFEEQVLSHPDNTAIELGDESINYATLNQRANQLAHYLIKNDLQSEELVAICLPRSIDLVVAIVASSKAGGVYVPIDPGLPQSRIETLLQNSNSKILITTNEIASQLDTNGITVINQNDYHKISLMTTENLNKLINSNNLAYIIFTSGSTGIPKGVATAHNSALNTIYSVNEAHNVVGKDRIFALSASNFDLSVYDIFGTLAVGACIVMIHEEFYKDPSVWLMNIINHRVTIWNSVPALMQMFILYLKNNSQNYSHQQALASIRVAMLSGDWIPLSLPNEIKKFIGQQCNIISMGGATEASIWSISYPIGDVDNKWKSIPYGKPMPNQKFYVLDQNLEPCPIGVIGNLYIGGVGLAKEYWQDPEKTSSSFIHHEKLNERLYYTGDMGRYLPDSNIEFLGRADFQIKLDGLRIEIGEIESAINQSQLVSTSIVTLCPDKKGQKHLVAYFIPATLDKDISMIVKKLQQYLAANLPDYMIPHKFIGLEVMPLSATGKINRTALVNPFDSDPQIIQGSTSLTPTEIIIRDMWIAVLGHQNFTMEQNFFEAGGNSLLIISLHKIIEDKFGPIIKIVNLFTYPYISKIAAQIQDREIITSDFSKQRERAQKRKQAYSTKQN